jgi:hypothetical protein
MLGWVRGWCLLLGGWRYFCEDCKYVVRKSHRLCRIRRGGMWLYGMTQTGESEKSWRDTARVQGGDCSARSDLCCLRT